MSGIRSPNYKPDIKARMRVVVEGEKVDGQLELHALDPLPGENRNIHPTNRSPGGGAVDEADEGGG